MMYRRAGSAGAAALVVAGLLGGSFAAGCGGHESGTYLKGAPEIYPETANLAPGGSTTFYGGILEVDEHKVSEDFRVQEKDGGSFVDAPNPENYEPNPALYTAPTKLGTYHMQWVWDAGTKNEKAATATITVTNTPPYTPVTPP